MKINISFIILLTSKLIYSQSANLDGDFAIGNGFSVGNTVSTMSLLNDNKIIISGLNFTNFNGTTLSSNIIRLNSNGTFDTNLNNGSVSLVNSIAQQNDGKIIMAGNAGFNFYRIRRFNTDFSIDNTFSVGINSNNGFNEKINKILIQNDGKILVYGNFTAYSSTTTKQLTRLTNNGSLDTNFNTNIINIPAINLTNGVRYFSLLSNGKILVATNSTPKLIRLNSDGTIDNTFTTSTVNNLVSTITEQSDNKILVSTTVGLNNGQLQRLNSDGSIDNTFTTYNITNALINEIHHLSTNKILISNFNGAPSSSRMVRLNSNGNIDSTFNIGTGFEDTISKIIIQPDGKILACGFFDSYNGVTKRGVLRLIGDSTLDTNYFSKNHINIYPNPVKDILNFDKNNKLQYEIYDITGKFVLNGNNNNVDVSAIEKGVYILKLIKDDIISTQKFIKE